MHTDLLGRYREERITVALKSCVQTQMMILDLQQPYHFFKIVRIMIKIEMKMYKYKKELEENYANK